MCAKLVSLVHQKQVAGRIQQCFVHRDTLYCFAVMNEKHTSKDMLRLLYCWCLLLLCGRMTLRGVSSITVAVSAAEVHAMRRSITSFSKRILPGSPAMPSKPSPVPRLALAMVTLANCNRHLVHRCSHSDSNPRSRTTPSAALIVTFLR